MVIKTVSTAYDDNGNVIASYDNEQTFNAEDVEDVIKNFKQKREPEHERAVVKNSEDVECPCGEPCDEPCCFAEEDEFCDEDGFDVVSVDVSVDTIKKVALIVGGFVGFRVLRKIAKAVL